MRMIRLACLTALCVVMVHGAALAQGAAPRQEGWDVGVYPVLVWVPLGIGIDVDIPPFGGDNGGVGDIVDARFDGAFLAGVNASNGTWRIEGDAIWYGVGGDRIERPLLTVDLNLIYGHASLGRRIAPGLFLTGGVRRLAFDYDIKLGELPKLSQKPGVWDPLVGIAWHRPGPKVEWHAAFEGGGFGVGTDVDLSGIVRVDWKPVRHFGFTGGYNILYLKITDTVLGRTLIVKPMVHGPVVGIGLYF